MKRKLTSVLALLLAVVMICPVTVFAAGKLSISGAPTGTKYFEKSKPSASAVTLTASGAAASEDYKWGLDDASVASITPSGNKCIVTPVNSGTVTITVSAEGKEPASKSITFEEKQIEELTYTEKTTFKNKQYYSGDSFDKSTIAVKLKYNDKTTSAEITDYIVTPATLTASTTSVTISYAGFSKEVTGIKVSEVQVSKVEISTPIKTDYVVGDTLSVELKLTYNNGSVAYVKDGFDLTIDGKSAVRPLTADDNGKTVVVTYKNAKVGEFKINVTPKYNPDDYTFVECKITKNPTKMKYQVGDTFNPDGMKVTFTYKDKDNKLITQVVDVKSATPTKIFTSSDKDLGYAVVDVNVLDPIAAVNRSVTLVVTVTDKLALKSISSVKTTGLYVGAKVSVSNIVSFIAKFEDNSTATIKTSSLPDGWNLKSLEVLSSTGKEKTKNYYYIEADDVDKYNEVGLLLKFTYNGEDYEQKIYADISDGNVVVEWGKESESYDTLEEALKNVNDISSSLYTVTITLNGNQSLSSGFEYKIEKTLTIDLNGHALEMRSTNFGYGSSFYKEYKIRVINSSTKKASLTYLDKSVNGRAATLSLDRSSELVFEFGGNLPGFYTLTIDKNIKNGTVTTSASSSILLGSSIEFTITPNKGYAIQDVLVNNKSVIKDSTNYTYNKNTGKATYVISSVTEDITIKAQFTDDNVWNNPYTDITEYDSYYSAIRFVVENGLFTGVSSNLFRPNTTMNRAMFVTVLGRLAGVNTNRYNSKTSFYDVNNDTKDNTWYAPYVEWANENGIIQGYGNGKFGPYDEITHAQMYTVMYRYALYIEQINVSKYVSGTSITVKDKKLLENERYSYAKDPVKLATACDYLVLDNGYMTPGDGAKRWELAVLLESFCCNLLGYEN